MTADSTPLVGSDDEIDLAEVVRILWKARWFIVAMVTAFTVTFVVVAYMTVPIYRATSVLLPSNHDRGIRGLLESTLGFAGGGLASLAGLSPDRSTRQVEEALAVLTSRSFIEAFITEKNLLPVLFPDAPADPQERPTLSQAHKFFTKSVMSIDRDSRTGLIAVHVEWRDRSLAAEWVNDLVHRINHEMRRRALDNADMSLRFLEAELKRTAFVGSQEAINRLIEAQINERMVANVTHQYAFQVVDPALAPDANDPVRPNKLMYLLLGVLLGGMLSVGAVIGKRLMHMHLVAR